MSDMNVCCFTGRLGGDAETKDASGKQKSRYRLAVGGRKDQATWLTCEHWDCPPALRALLTKGQRVAVSGRLEEQQWTSQDGTKKSAYVVVVYNLQILSPPRPAEERPATVIPGLGGRHVPAWESEDTPF
jgi:single-strand DNA-binding protein